MSSSGRWVGGKGICSSSRSSPPPHSLSKKLIKVLPVCRVLSLSGTSRLPLPTSSLTEHFKSGVERLSRPEVTGLPRSAVLCPGLSPQQRLLYKSPVRGKDLGFSRGCSVNWPWRDLFTFHSFLLAEKIHLGKSADAEDSCGLCHLRLCKTLGFPNTLPMSDWLLSKVGTSKLLRRSFYVGVVLLVWIQGMKSWIGNLVVCILEEGS